MVRSLNEVVSSQEKYKSSRNMLSFIHLFHHYLLPKVSTTFQSPLNHGCTTNPCDLSISWNSSSRQTSTMAHFKGHARSKPWHLFLKYYILISLGSFLKISRDLNFSWICFIQSTNIAVGVMLNIEKIKEWLQEK